ncbi:MAG: thioredoxin family protein [Xenococcaceae cyanobacterium]
MLFSVNEQTFEQEVLASSQPVLVHFWAPWCGLCLMINPVLLKLEAEIDRPIKLVSINADNNFKLATFYRLKNLPTLMLFERGSLVERLDDFQHREGLEQTIANLMNQVIVQSA